MYKFKPVENKFKVGEKVKPNKLYGIGNCYGIGRPTRDTVKNNYKILTVREYLKNAYEDSDCVKWDVIYFKEVGCFWPINWFDKVNTQLEFDFNG
jgi:hypothetical protein